MLPEIINHSLDLLRLVREGYEMELKGGYLLIHHVPYINSKKEIKYATLVSDLNLSGPDGHTIRPVHTIHFIGEHPCHVDGKVMTEIINSTHSFDLGSGIRADHFFSSKPICGFYADYHEKVTRYVSILSAPARNIDASVTAQTFRPLTDSSASSVLHYEDTNALRANINALKERFIHQKIAIIGLGGSGSYLLDLLAKLKVLEIHLFDKDFFLQHNAFRAPGAASLELLQRPEKIRKVNYLGEIYSRMHKHIIMHDEFADEENISFFKKLSFVFVCVDNGPARKMIIQSLIAMNIPFIDTGIGIEEVDGKLLGMVRVPTGTPQKNDHISERISFDDDKNDDYSSNIQIAELNMLSAAYAVIKWKKLCGFYHDSKNEHHSLYTINTSQFLHDDTAA